MRYLTVYLKYFVHGCTSKKKKIKNKNVKIVISIKQSHSVLNSNQFREHDIEGPNLPKKVQG